MLYRLSYTLIWLVFTKSMIETKTQTKREPFRPSHLLYSIVKQTSFSLGQAERTGFEPAEGFDPFTDLANRRFRPLSHRSKTLKELVGSPSFEGRLCVMM